ncbi:LysR family transcriptional regulator [Variovorax paradoxus]|uniref:LysR family transcriptional regulator n=1 Tax=Variovorax paradoxus TaxID=34073 RepID=UPI0019345AF4|nr:LysR family transcriptional regulator [Variovorax paradoxus]
MTSPRSASIPASVVTRQASQLDEIQAFVAVGQTGSFSAAAALLSKDASTISRRIAALERRLGVRLIARTTRRLAITEAGNSYLARMSAVLEEMANADAELSARGNRPQGLLRISLPRTYGRLWLAPLLPRFMAAYPDVQLDVRFSDQFVDLVSEDFDVAVRLGALQSSSLVARKVGEVRRHVYASAAYLRAHGTPSAPREIAQHRCLGFAGYQRSAEWSLRKGRQRVTVGVKLAMHTDDSDSLITAAAEGAGLVIATGWLVEKHPLGGKLRPVLPDWEVGEPGAIYIVTPTASFLPAKVRVFIEMVSGALRR